MALLYQGRILDQLSFDSDSNSFVITNSNYDESISVSFIPVKEKEEFDTDKYLLFPLENNSLNAENDIYIVHETDIKKDIGWIFPLSTLESNENDYSDKKFFNQFRFLAYQKLLSSAYPDVREIKDQKQNYLLSDLFEDDPIILIVSLEACGISFELDNYLPALASHGYFKKNEYPLRFKCPDDIIEKWYRGKKKVNLKSAKNPIYNSFYSKNLYKNYLKSLDHHLIRFHLIYQIVENHISEIFNSEFQKVLLEFQNSLSTKNNFIESINKARNERDNIRKVLKKINPNEGTFEKQMMVNLKRDCRDFLDQFNVEERQEIGDLVYDVRNILVHNYREVKEDDYQVLTEITFGFEIMVHYLMGIHDFIE